MVDIFAINADIKEKQDAVNKILATMPTLPKGFTTTHARVQLQTNDDGTLQERVSIWAGPVKHYDMYIYQLQELAAIVQKMFGIPEVNVREEK